MKAVNVDDVLKILYKYGEYIFVTDEKRYSDMVDEISNIKELQNPCENTISRQAVLDILRNNYRMEALDLIEDLPSVTPKPKIGHWIKATPFFLSECSECGNKAFGNHGFDEVLTKYCPNCGARMAESEEEE